MVRRNILSLSNESKVILALMILFIVPAVVGIKMAEYDKSGLHYMSDRIFFNNMFTFFIVFITAFLSLITAVINKKNKVSFLFFSIIGIILTISAIGIAVFLSIKYTEIAFFFTLSLALAAIVALLDSK